MEWCGLIRIKFELMYASKKYLNMMEKNMLKIFIKKDQIIYMKVIMAKAILK